MFSDMFKFLKRLWMKLDFRPLEKYLFTEFVEMNDIPGNLIEYLLRKRYYANVTSYRDITSEYEEGVHRAFGVYNESVYYILFLDRRGMIVCIRKYQQQTGNIVWN